MRNSRLKTESEKRALRVWKAWCEENGYLRSEAARACRLAFMRLPEAERERLLADALETLKD
jgi:hypothetical protein